MTGDVAAPPDRVTVDAFAGGRVELVQPARRGHRAGLEAALLGAAVDTDQCGTVVDLGAGSGAAGLMVASRCDSVRVLLADCDRDALARAGRSLELPANANFAGRVGLVRVDVAAAEATRVTAGLGRMSADVVVCNPPFRAVARACASPHAQRRLAHILDDGGLSGWVTCAASVLKPGGRLVLVLPPELLAPALAALDRSFGGADLLPVFPRAGRAASRFVLSALCEGRENARILPGLVLHADDGSAYVKGADDILRGDRNLSDLVPAGWHCRRAGATAVEPR